MKVGCRRRLPARLSGDRAAGGLERRLSREAASYWHQTDEQVMARAAFIPLQTQLTPLCRSRRVCNAILSTFSGSCAITQVWLSL